MAFNRSLAQSFTLGFVCYPRRGKSSVMSEVDLRANKTKKRRIAYKIRYWQCKKLLETYAHVQLSIFFSQLKVKIIFFVLY